MKLVNVHFKSQEQTHLLNDIRAEFLYRKSTNVTSKLANNGIAEAVVVQIQNILDNLKSGL
jgi:hypothetical protein